MGGFVFKALESGFEQDVRKAIVIEREKLMNEMFRFVEAKLNSSANITDIARMVKEKTEDSLTKYSDFIYEQTTENGWDGKQDMDEENGMGEQWSFASSLLYAITVMTTIGK